MNGHRKTPSPSPLSAAGSTGRFGARREASKAKFDAKYCYRFLPYGLSRLISFLQLAYQ
jgi:hypothetical protein